MCSRTDVIINMALEAQSCKDREDTTQNTFGRPGPSREHDSSDLDSDQERVVDNVKDFFEDSDCSVKDKDYIPGSESSESDEDTFNSQPHCDEANSVVQSGSNSENANSLTVNEHFKEKQKRRKFPKPEDWKRNTQRRLKQTGQAYTSTTGKRIQSKTLQPKDCSRCPRKCNTSFTNQDRENIHENYWKMGNPEKQRQYISSLIDEHKKASIRTAAGDESRRQKTKTYYLIKDNEKVQVCKKFFLSTFSLSGKFTDGVLKNRNENNIVQIDKRGHHVPGVKIRDENRDFIRSHIRSFPVMPAHYCRKDSSKEYLEKDLNIQKMYDLYLQKCKEEKVKPEKQWLYRDIFTKEFNLAFYTPKKDICDFCFKYERMSADEKVLNKTEYENHIRRKDAARKLKNDIKEKALNGECHLAEFDLQAVLYCPKSLAKALFYRNKLAVYNFTILSLEKKIAYCYMWHEGIGARGSIETASCVFDFLGKIASGKTVNFFSDTCGGQNRNVNMTAMFLYAVQTLDVPQINQMFFESGHSQMECDSVHAQIEKKSKNLEVYDPSGWYTAVRMASPRRTPKSDKKTIYEVIEMGQDTFLNFDSLQKNIIKNRKIDSNGQSISWLKIKWFQFRKEDPQHIYFKYDQNDGEFLKFEVARRRRNFDFSTLKLTQKYNLPLVVKEKKLKDLLELCTMGIIREPYHAFYKSLSSEPESGTRDSSDDEA